MGSGEFGSNGSVHWKVSYDDDASYADHVDYDELRHTKIGKKKKHPGKFRVTARYETVADARKALKEAQARFKKTPSRILHLDVDAREEQPNPGPSHDWELRIDW
jgi:hypothetical protein